MFLKKKICSLGHVENQKNSEFGCSWVKHIWTAEMEMRMEEGKELSDRVIGVGVWKI